MCNCPIPLPLPNSPVPNPGKLHSHTQTPFGQLLRPSSFAPAEKTPKRRHALRPVCRPATWPLSPTADHRDQECAPAEQWWRRRRRRPSASSPSRTGTEGARGVRHAPDAHLSKGGRLYNRASSAKMSNALRLIAGADAVKTCVRGCRRLPIASRKVSTFFKLCFLIKNRRWSGRQMVSYMEEFHNFYSCCNSGHFNEIGSISGKKVSSANSKEVIKSECCECLILDVTSVKWKDYLRNLLRNRYAQNCLINLLAFVFLLVINNIICQFYSMKIFIDVLVTLNRMLLYSFLLISKLIYPYLIVTLDLH